MLGLGQRDGVRGAVDRFGQLLLTLLHLTAEPDEHVMLEDLAVDGDRAKLGPVDPGLHRAPHPLRIDTPATAMLSLTARSCRPTARGRPGCGPARPGPHGFSSDRDERRRR